MKLFGILVMLLIMAGCDDPSGDHQLQADAAKPAERGANNATRMDASPAEEAERFTLSN
jgi:hypothetical protein